MTRNTRCSAYLALSLPKELTNAKPSLTREFEVCHIFLSSLSTPKNYIWRRDIIKICNNYDICKQYIYNIIQISRKEGWRLILYITWSLSHQMTKYIPQLCPISNLSGTLWIGLWDMRCRYCRTHKGIYYCLPSPRVQNRVMEYRFIWIQIDAIQISVLCFKVASVNISF